jgi:hypothetical protein
MGAQNLLRGKVLELEKLQVQAKLVSEGQYTFLQIR